MSTTVALSVSGVLVGLAGGVLLYLFHDPAHGHGIMLESFNPRREKVGARLGLALVALGAAMQAVAALA